MQHKFKKGDKVRIVKMEVERNPFKVGDIVTADKLCNCGCGGIMVTKGGIAFSFYPEEVAPVRASNADKIREREAKHAAQV
jgi:hypothetical protein